MTIEQFDKHYQERILYMSEIALSGILGNDAKSASEDYTVLGEGYPRLVRYIDEIYSTDNVFSDYQLLSICDQLCQYIIVIYREAKGNDENVAHQLLMSFHKDYPGTTGTCLFPTWESLINASIAFKQCPKDNYTLVWQQSTRLVQAYNEFINKLLGFLYIGWCVAQDVELDIKVFKMGYRNKLRKFEEITNGENGAFYLIFRLATPDLRNSIAHEDISNDYNKGIVKYVVGNKKKIIREMSTLDFLAKASSGSVFAQSYLLALSVITLLEADSDAYSKYIPKHLIRVFNFETK